MGTQNHQLRCLIGDYYRIVGDYYRKEELKMNDRAKFLETNEDQKERIENIRQAMSLIYNAIDGNCKPSRETSLVYTKLEEAQFWAIKGITREEV